VIRPALVRQAPLALTVGLVLALAGGATPASDQHGQDDHADQDRRYQDRLRQMQESGPPPPAATPEEARAEIVQRFVAFADQLIRDKNYNAASTDAYVVKTDDPRLDVRKTAGLLTSFRSWFDTFWSGRAELLPDDPPSRIYLFWSYYKYNQLFSGKERFDEFRTTGHYRGYLDTVVVHTDGTPTGDLADVLVHETAHQLIGNRLFGDGATLSPWVSEGLAEYFAYTRQNDDGTFATGEIGGKSVWPFRSEKPSRSGMARGRRDAALRRAKQADGWTVDELLRATPAQFYGGAVQANYGASWLVVHFLFHGEGGRYADAFARWLREQAPAGPPASSLYEALGTDAASLDRAWAGYADKLKVR
jgi:hypothetical protein